MSKGHHPSAVPGLGPVPPILRPRGWRWGARPKSREMTGVRLTSFLPPSSVTAPSGTNWLAGEGVNSFHCWGGGGPSQLLSLFRGGGEGETQCLLPHPSLPGLPEAPFLTGTPGKDLRRGRRGRVRGGDAGLPAPAGKSSSAAPLPSSSPKGGEQGEGRGPPGQGRGSPRPSPRGTLGLVFPPLHCIPGSRREGRGGTGRPVWAEEKGWGGVPAESGRR